MAGQEMKTHVLLLGSTGHGKSSLGNLLVNPTLAHLREPEKWTFPVGRTRESCTRACSLGCSDDVIVMDTPGLNESHQRDLRNMIHVVKQAHALGKAHAIVLVMRMDSRMDQTYKDTVKYYHNLFGPEIFSSRLVLMLTNFRQNDYQYQGEEGTTLVEQIKTQSSGDVGELLNLQESPVFCINCHPNDEEDLNAQVEVSEQFLNKARQCPPASLKDLRVPKTEAVKKRHAIEAAGLKRHIEAKEEEKRELESLQPSEVYTHQELKRSVQEAEGRIDGLEAELGKLDTKDLVRILEEVQCVERGVGKGGTGSGWHFDMDCSPVPIRQVKQGGKFYESGAVRYREVHRTMYQLQCNFERRKGKWFSGGELRVECLGYKCDLHATEIKQKRKEVEKQQQLKLDGLKEMAQIEKTQKKLKSDAKTVELEITKSKKKLEELESTHFVSIEEAEEEAALLEPQSKL